MIRCTITMTCALLCALLAGAASLQAAPQAGQTRPAIASPIDGPALIQSQLDAFVANYLQSCNTALRPGKSCPEVNPRDGKMVSTYIELDPATAKTELYASNSGDFAYLAKLTYVEHTYEAVGNSPEEALNGVYMRIKSRRLTELPRYVGGVWRN